MDKETKRKRKRDQNAGEVAEEQESSSCAGSTEHNKCKRVHVSECDAETTLSADQQEKMLDTVSGHIQELAMKEKEINSPSNTSDKTIKTTSKLKKTKSRVMSSKSNEETDDREARNEVTESPTQESVENSAPVSEQQQSCVSQHSALEYLRQWKEENDKWSFKKKTQYWLLQNMYDRTKVPKSGFRMLLRYLVGLRGHQRELCKQKAQKMVDQFGEGSTITRRYYKRAVAIMRVLG